jgi:hypothetical protein
MSASIHNSLSKQLGILFILFVVATNVCVAQPIRNPIVPMQFYGALATDDTTQLFKMLDDLKYAATNQELAYKGTLLMKKASTIRSPKGLSVFNQGKKMLDNIILKEKENPEFRFLRLVIQENCPKQLNYHSNLKTDAALLKKKFNELGPQVQGAVQDYSNNSKVLKPSDFSK